MFRLPPYIITVTNKPDSNLSCMHNCVTYVGSSGRIPDHRHDVHQIRADIPPAGDLLRSDRTSAEAASSQTRLGRSYR